MSTHITEHRAGFAPGVTDITSFADPDEPTALGLAVMVLRAGEEHVATAANETAYLMMSGAATVAVDNRRADMKRSSLFDDGPSCVHISAGTEIRIAARQATEFTIYRCANQKRFAAAIYLPGDTADEQRGKGQVGGACLRLVRTIFDRTRADSNAELVLGEVITLPGRWSSYPPHHHPQPEIYHYRFTHPQGYGHAEHGEHVFRVRQNDTVKILSGNDHAQCAAPGYGMYYAWVIRHLPGNPYTVPEFTAEHRWTMEKDAAIWLPKGLDRDA
ncbi:MAG TPA: 5-deoxy-glucuronate isomerase [Alphaproteobacteria bacterium]|nr:5-deoxy-glucuronate isomerase [Alphaproteobacteria bacterium]